MCRKVTCDQVENVGRRPRSDVVIRNCQSEASLLKLCSQNILLEMTNLHTTTLLRLQDPRQQESSEPALLFEMLEGFCNLPGRNMLRTISA